MVERLYLPHLQLPEVWGSQLPDDLSRLIISFFDESSDGLNKPGVLLPFNSHTFTRLARAVIVRCCTYKDMLFHYRWVISDDHIRVIKNLVKPLYRLFYMDELIGLQRIETLCFKSRSDCDEKWSSGARADELLAIVTDLDAAGFRLEATLLCLHRNFEIALRTAEFPEIGKLEEWTADDRSLLSDEDWRTNSINLERMRLIRTIWYLEYRAFHGRLGARNELRNPGLTADISKSARPNEAPNFLRWPFGEEDPVHTRFRWFEMHHNTFGLQFDELAQVCHARVLLNQTLLAHWDESDEAHILLKEPHEVNMAINAVTAWYMDPFNEVYSSLLRSIMENASAEHLHEIRKSCVRRVEGFRALGTGYVPYPWFSWASESGEHNMSNAALNRATQLALDTEVGYQERRYQGRKGWIDLFERFTNPQVERPSPCCKYCDEFELNIHMLPERVSDQWADGVADWSTSSWREPNRESETRAKYCT